MNTSLSMGTSWKHHYEGITIMFSSQPHLFVLMGMLWTCVFTVMRTLLFLMRVLWTYILLWRRTLWTHHIPCRYYEHKVPVVMATRWHHKRDDGRQMIITTTTKTTRRMTTTPLQLLDVYYLTPETKTQPDKNNSTPTVSLLHLNQTSVTHCLPSNYMTCKCC